MSRTDAPSILRAVLVPLFFLVYFNLLFSFENVPSTPILRPVAKLSIETCVLLFVLASVVTFGRHLHRAVRALLAFAIFALSLVRYVDVTAYGVLGRAFNLHGDFPHLHRVFAMFWEALTLSTGLAIVSVVLLLSIAAIWLNNRGLVVWERVFENARPRRVALMGIPAALVLFGVLPGNRLAFTTSSMVAQQVRNLRVGEAEKVALETIEWPAQHLNASLDRLGGAHVFLIFLESYGVTLLEDSQHFDALRGRYQQLEERLGAAGYHFRSSQIQSPTFGGGSWRAHASLLSGVHVDSEHIYDALVDSDRATLVSVLRDRGYRTVAAEPGIKWYWPEGEFFGFDEIYAFDELDYDGPPIGWWKIPDQFTLHRLFQEEIDNATGPVFAKVSLIMTHIPYFPIPEYVDDWSRFDDGTAFDVGMKSVAHDAYRDIRELSSWYVESFRYELDVVEGFLTSYVPENSLTIVLGDHQPPKLVTHNNDSWAVPIHVFSKKPDLVEAFEAVGFTSGLVPLQPSALRMADFLERFVEIYDSGDVATLATDP